MTSKDLSQVSRELAKRVVPHPQTCTEQYCTCTGWLIENRFRVEAVIREAIEKTLEEVERATAHLSCDYCKAVRQVPAIIRSLKAVASSLTEQENKND